MRTTIITNSVKLAPMDYYSQFRSTLTPRARGMFDQLGRRAYRTYRAERKAELRMCRLIRKGL